MKTSKSALTALVLAALLALGGCATGGNSFFDEAATTTRVKRAIHADPGLKVMDISVSTEDGVVELTGTVKTRAERLKAAEVARKVEGVRKVNNQLKVQ